MKKKIIIISTFLLVGIGLLYAYSPTEEYQPIIVERTQFESSIASMPSQKLIHPGKIFILGTKLFVIEKFYGVHIFENSNPSSPQKLGFIRILGCTDIVVKGNVMYASSAVDLVTIDITNLANAKEVDREKNILPEIVSPEGYIEQKYSVQERPAETIIIAWKTVKN